jgi:hypothetical protein
MRRSLLALVMVTAACHDPATAPSAPPAPEVQAVAPTRISLIASPGELPAGGGSARIFIETAAGSAVAPRIAVNLTASNGALDQGQVVTDDTGHASVGWNGTTTSTITAVAGGVTSSMDVRVIVPPPPIPPSPVPPPRPTPTPTTPSPSPTQDPVNVTLRADRTTVPVGGAVSFTATVSQLQPGETITMYRWDLDGDGTDEGTTGPEGNVRTSAAYTAHGPVDAKVTVTTSAGRTANTIRQIVVTN